MRALKSAIAARYREQVKKIETLTIELRNTESLASLPE